MTRTDDLYWETDDTEPDQVIYDLEEHEQTEDEIMTPTPLPVVKKTVSRNVGNTRRRRFR